MNQQRSISLHRRAAWGDTWTGRQGPGTLDVQPQCACREVVTWQVLQTLSAHFWSEHHCWAKSSQPRVWSQAGLRSTTENVTTSGFQLGTASTHTPETTEAWPPLEITCDVVTLSLEGLGSKRGKQRALGMTLTERLVGRGWAARLWGSFLAGAASPCKYKFVKMDSVDMVVRLGDWFCGFVIFVAGFAWFAVS